MPVSFEARVPAIGAILMCVSCSAADDRVPDGGPPLPEAAAEVNPALPEAGPADATTGATFCSLPGSFVWTGQGVSKVAGGGAGAPDLSWLHLPAGFCAHYFGTVPDARQLRFAPDGNLFVASPTTATTGGGANGVAGIVILPDDDRDGFADSNVTFLDQLRSTQGLMFADGFLYYQDDVSIRRVAYHPHDRQPNAPLELMTTMTVTQDSLHWPKVFDKAKDGTIYVTNGSSQGEACDCARPAIGAVFRLNADGSMAEVAKGFRNPIALRCETDHDVCLVAELALDYSAPQGGREKIVPVHQGDDWGFPCCATKNVPYSGVTCQGTGQVPQCAGTASESAAFVIGHTPFGLDFETVRWPDPWAHRVFVTLHGEAGTWSGARVVAIALDPATGLPLPASELDGTPSSSNLLEFATGWDDGAHDHGRPAPVTFAPDGRLFLGDDNNGLVVWIAPIGLTR